MENISIGTRIKQRRKELGLTQLQIKQTTGISSGNLSDIENGNKLPSAPALLSLSTILECSIDWILKGDIPKGENDIFSMEEIGTRIKSLREHGKLTQQELGNIVSLHGSNIGRIEKGKVYPTADVIMKLSKHFKVSCDWIIFGESANMQIYENPNEYSLLFKYRHLPETAQKDIMEYLDFKIDRLSKKKGSVETSSNLDSKTNLA